MRYKNLTVINLKKNIMKKIKILLAVAFIGILSYGICSAHGGMSSNETNQLLLENVEAIADDEIGGNNYNICYYESRVRRGYTYYNCSTCNTKTYDEKGKGSYSKCFY